MTATLRRLMYLPEGTFGEVLVGARRVCFTCEQTWNANIPSASCVPEGMYSLIPFDGVKYQDTYALVGETVSAQPIAGKPRYACVIHTANLPFEVEGCIAPGLSIGMIEGQLAVHDSAIAYDRLLTAIKREGLTKLHVVRA